MSCQILIKSFLFCIHPFQLCFHHQLLPHDHTHYFTCSLPTTSTPYHIVVLTLNIDRLKPHTTYLHHIEDGQLGDQPLGPSHHEDWLGSLRTSHLTVTELPNVSDSDLLQCTSLWCTPCVYGRAARRLDNFPDPSTPPICNTHGWIFYFSGYFYACAVPLTMKRGDMRDSFKIEGATWKDCLVSNHAL